MKTETKKQIPAELCVACPTCLALPHFVCVPKKRSPWSQMGLRTHKARKLAYKETVRDYYVSSF